MPHSLTSHQQTIDDPGCAARNQLVLEHVEAHMLALHSLVGRRGKLKPIVAQRNQLAVVLDRALERLATHPAAIAARAQALEAAEQAAFEARHPR